MHNEPICNAEPNPNPYARYFIICVPDAEHVTNPDSECEQNSSVNMESICKFYANSLCYFGCICIAVSHPNPLDVAAPVRLDYIIFNSACNSNPSCIP
jgi:hypothetical protein